MHSSVPLYFCFLLAWALRVLCPTPKMQDKLSTVFEYIYNSKKDAQQVWTCSWKEVVFRVPTLCAFGERLLWISSSLVLRTEHQFSPLSTEVSGLKGTRCITRIQTRYSGFFFFFPPIQQKIEITFLK